jgi:hypothetical protein
MLLHIHIHQPFLTGLLFQCRKEIFFFLGVVGCTTLSQLLGSKLPRELAKLTFDKLIPTISISNKVRIVWRLNMGGLFVNAIQTPDDNVVNHCHNARGIYKHISGLVLSYVLVLEIVDNLTEWAWEV